MLNPMETNKLLTLEEIEGYEKTPAYTSPTTKRLLATARAYCELIDRLKKNIPMLRQWLNEDRKANPLVHSHDIAQWLEVPMEFKGYMSIADEQKIIDAVKPGDKPHLPTLKVIVEAMKEILKNTDLGYVTVDYDDLAVIAESLEKHLE